MSDSKNNTGNPDRSLVNMGEAYEVQYWKDKFGVSKEELQEAVDAVGSSTEKVEQYLKGNR